jgi:hypothetical protein
MTTDEPLKLKLGELAALVVLMSENRELSNPQMKELYGIDLTGSARTTLAGLGLVGSRKGYRGAYFHTLSDKGWAECSRLAAVPRPAGAGAGGGALMALLAGVDRALRQRRLSHGDFFSLTEAEEVDVAEIKVQIRAAYAKLAQPGDQVSLAALHELLPHVSRDDFDGAVRILHREPDVYLQPRANLKALTPDERDAAILVGGVENHVLVIGD